MDARSASPLGGDEANLAVLLLQGAVQASDAMERLHLLATDADGDSVAMTQLDQAVELLAMTRTSLLRHLDRLAERSPAAQVA